MQELTSHTISVRHICLGTVVRFLVIPFAFTRMIFIENIVFCAIVCIQRSSLKI